VLLVIYLSEFSGEACDKAIAKEIATYLEN
jgi:hypothetical protein